MKLLSLFKRKVIAAFGLCLFAACVMFSCKKNAATPQITYYEVGVKGAPADWRDSSFIIATADTALIAAVNRQLALPVAQRKMVSGALAAGSGGYNKNATHSFAWHFKEDNWQLTEVSAEIFDGRPYSDVDMHLKYWMDTVKRFAPWNSYIRRKLVQ